MSVDPVARSAQSLGRFIGEPANGLFANASHGSQPGLLKSSASGHALFGVDADTLRDFVAEAQEILDRLSVQLVDLEQRPDDIERLNAVFRGFHTIKGGADFLHLDALVEICHTTENLFDRLRSGKLRIYPALMDVALQVLDALGDQLQQLAQGHTPDLASRDLVALLNLLVSVADDAEESLADSFGAGDTSASPANTISDEEFEQLLDQLHGPGTAPSGISAPESIKSAPAAQGIPAANAPSACDATESVRVDVRQMDNLLAQVNALAQVRNRLVQLGLQRADDALSQALAHLNTVTTDLQATVMHIRMQPIGRLFERFPRVVRDLARTLNKDVRLSLLGEDTLLDRHLVEALADPLIHLLRNAVDHGIEQSAARRNAGKSSVGHIVLSAEASSDQLLLVIDDDGAGMHPHQLRQKAVEKGLYSATLAAQLSDADAFNLIFVPGFSTCAAITKVSGRGVGMDVVKTRIAQLKGTIDVQSQMGGGTRFLIRVPLPRPDTSTHATQVRCGA